MFSIGITSDLPFMFLYKKLFCLFFHSYDFLCFQPAILNVDHVISTAAPKGRFTRYDFCLRLSHAIFYSARCSRHAKIVYNFHRIKLPVDTIVVGF